MTSSTPTIEESASSPVAGGGVGAGVSAPLVLLDLHEPDSYDERGASAAPPIGIVKASGECPSADVADKRVQAIWPRQRQCAIM